MIISFFGCLCAFCCCVSLFSDVFWTKLKTSRHGFLCFCFTSLTLHAITHLPTIRPHALTSHGFLKRPFSSPWLKKITYLVWKRWLATISYYPNTQRVKLLFLKRSLPAGILSDILLRQLSDMYSGILYCQAFKLTFYIILSCLYKIKTLKCLKSY